MVADNLTNKIINSPNTEQLDFERIREILEKYADYLQRQLDIKKIGQCGDYSQLDHETQMADLEHNGMSYD